MRAKGMCWYMDYVNPGWLCFYLVLQYVFNIVIFILFFFLLVLDFILISPFFLDKMCCSEYCMHTFLILKKSNLNLKQMEWRDYIHC